MIVKFFVQEVEFKKKVGLGFFKHFLILVKAINNCSTVPTS